MDFIEAKIYTTTEGIDPVTSRLMDTGITGFIIEDSADFENFLTDTTIYWDYVDEKLMELKNVETNITVYIADNNQGAETLANIRSQLADLRSFDTENNYGRLEIELANVREEDWANNWKQYFKPFEVGEKFVVKPSWETYNNNTDRHIIEIDPSTSFGTGSHDTTQLCMISLEKYVTSDTAELLDMGCGSGILSAAALYLGAKHITAVDIDENSVRIANENISGNGFSKDRYDAVCGNILADEALEAQLKSTKYNVIVANIVADIIRAMSGFFMDSLCDDGTLITSGIISSRKDDVISSLCERGFELVSTHESHDWVSLTFRKA